MSGGKKVGEVMHQICIPVMREHILLTAFCRSGTTTATKTQRNVCVCLCTITDTQTSIQKKKKNKVSQLAYL